VILLGMGQIVKGIVLIVAGVLVIGLVDNVLRPVLVGRDTQMPCCWRHWVGSPYSAFRVSSSGPSLRRSSWSSERCSRKVCEPPIPHDERSTAEADESMLDGKDDTWS
jgi:hypothetical protein